MTLINKLLGIFLFLCYCSDNERSQIAYVTFKDANGAETSVLLSVNSLIDQCVLTYDCKLSILFSNLMIH